MRLKRIGILSLVVVIVAGIFIAVDLLTPKETEAIPGLPSPVRICCLLYAIHQCPQDVQDLCFSDCMEASCGMN